MTRPTPWPHFGHDELKCQCGCGAQNMDADFMTKLEALRAAYGSPLKITSAYRCPGHNSRVSGSGTTGAHTTGKAVDIGISGQDADRLLRLAVKMDFSGIGIKQHGSGRYLHLDMMPDGQGFARPITWTYK
ncbi:MAG: DUF882 domain-containing protein [Magnetococcales bacterium]|nr:DUF882 domain-containing protein [Magnetococcales bacterium]